MSKSGKWIAATIGVVIILFIGWRLGGSKKKIEKVAVAKTAKRTIIETVPTDGKINPVSQVTISPDFSGQVTDLYVEEGDTVKKGKLLARINNRTSIESPINGVVLALKVKKGESVTGNSFSVGTEMMIIADMSSLEVKVDVGENDIIKLHKGDSAEVIVEAYEGRKFKGWVTSIPTSPKTNSGFNVSNDVTEYEVRIQLDTSSYADLSDRFPFRPGMNARAEIRTKREENILAVPISAVTTRLKGSDKSLAERKREQELNKDKDMSDGAQQDIDDVLEDVVFVLQKDGTVKKVPVEIGIQDIYFIQIKKGITEGDEVITDPYSAVSKTLKDGMKVKVVPRDRLFQE